MKTLFAILTAAIILVSASFVSAETNKTQNQWRRPHAQIESRQQYTPYRHHLYNRIDQRIDQRYWPRTPAVEERPRFDRHRIDTRIDTRWNTRLHTGFHARQHRGWGHSSQWRYRHHWRPQRCDNGFRIVIVLPVDR